VKESEWVTLPTEEQLCESCEFPTGCEEYEHGEDEHYMLCDICASTHLSSPVWYPRLFNDNEKKLFQSMGWLGNMLKSEIRRSR
jgi:hypothetical protein